MAQKVQITLVDDMTGEDIPEGAGGNVLFGIDNVTYSIDLNDRNETKLRKALEPFIAKGKRVSGKVKTTSVRRTQAGHSAREVRDWARSNGHEVPDRGRIPGPVKEAFDAAH